MKKLYYVTTVNVDENSAQAGQIKSMSSAFSESCGKNFKLLCFGKDRRNSSYAIYSKFRKRKLARSLLIICKALFNGALKANIFTRDIYIAAIFILLGSKVVWECHQNVSGANLYLLNLLSRCNNFRVLAISETLMSSRFLAHTNKFFYHDGVSTGLLNLEKYTGNERNKKLAIYTGALHKGADIDSLFPLFENRSDWTFMIIGGDAEIVNRYRKKCNHLKNVSFLGRMNHSDVIDMQRKASVLLYPLTRSNHLWEYTSPLKIFEYMAARKPIVGSCIGSVREILNSNNSFIYDDNKNINIAFDEYLNAKDSVLTRMTDANIQDIITKYNWQTRANYIINETYN